MRLSVVTPSRVCFDGEAKMISLTGQSGSLSVMDGHIPLVTPVKPGQIRIYLDDKIISGVTGGGLLSVTKEKTSFLTEEFEETENAV